MEALKILRDVALKLHGSGVMKTEYANRNPIVHGRKR